jgi:predicted negative regulator of RcsB-dependent stress response
VWILLLGAFAPITHPVDKILSLVGVLILVVYLGATSWEERRKRQADQSFSAAIFSSIRGHLNIWTLLLPLAFGLLSLGTLAPISDLLDKVLSWVAVAIMLVWVGVPMWEYHREREADQSSSAAISSSDQT